MEFKINDISINYEEIGTGKPIIMLHGFLLNHRVMTGCMEPILENQDGYRRIYIDLPGMGKSESADWIENADVMLDILIHFINTIIPHENFLLAGESYGGYLARGIIYRMANRIDGLLLLCPVIIAAMQQRTVPEHVCLVEDKGLLQKLPVEGAESFASLSVVQSKSIYKRYEKEILSGARLADAEFLERYRANGYAFSFNVDTLSEKFKKPMLFLMGKQDSVVGYKDAWNILENYPRASFVVLDKAGHNLQIEQEEVYQSLVYEWIQRTEVT
ncbi:alpha/beta fold hydrolase [Priestia taiwanensis]|uniref:2-hydroxy-6-oxo-6-phenylhexa-2,4-dienoate hydrolase n=1 Tax=Priestia taiwanensis TaxID=1347902 RepID=A0A917ANL4_9BACI|nr:alpha/beta hydrolase [Priestia taiwanensis]MBM7362639.1 pimeloyl-ACP methyl ester carboxylesterase [Priestia taiwanensis]GGE63875.1 2-hydroxy-6-oxo-6-phenylhexa-2,4-dienoate hydrolase [Priestia taiwanensis]